MQVLVSQRYFWNVYQTTSARSWSGNMASSSVRFSISPAVTLAGIFGVEVNSDSYAKRSLPDLISSEQKI